MTNLMVHPEVADDLIKAQEWYRKIDLDLAESFLESAYTAMELAQAAPEQYSKIYRDFRRVLCNRFPYKVVFEIIEADQAVHIVAVSHTSRHPDSWKNRMES